MIDTATLSARFLDAQLAGDRQEAIRLLLDDGLRAGLDVQTILVEVIQRSQREIGRLWQQNLISVADEHLATAVSQLAMARLFVEAPRRPRVGKLVTLACVEGELHDMGIRVAADVLEMEGFDVRLLGGNVPLDDLIARLRRERGDVLALSVTMTFNLPALRTAVPAVREAIGPDLPILAGGHAFAWSPDAAAGLDLAARSDDAMTMVRDVRQIVGV